MATEVGLYARISDDKDQTAAGVGRQQDDCLELAARRGWLVGQRYIDNDVSAYQRRVVRPAFERLLSDLEAGVIGGVVVYDLDRLARQPRDLERLVALYEDRAGLVFATVTGDYDLSDPNGLFMARTMVNMANKSSADTARRVARVHRQRALDGIPVGGTRPFGWQDDKRTLNEPEAARLRTAVGDVLAGKPLASVVVEWQAAGLLTTRGNAWTRASLVKTMTNPRLAGFSARNSGKGMEIVRREDGAPVLGQWEPIIRPEEWEAVCGALAVRRPRPGTGGTVTKYLLSGIARCGVCHRPLRAIPRSRAKGPATYSYLCQSRSAGGCGGVSRIGPKVDEYVVAALLAKMRQEFESASVAIDMGPWPRESELAEAQEAVTTLRRDLEAGRVTSSRLDLLEAKSVDALC